MRARVSISPLAWFVPVFVAVLFLTAAWTRVRQAPLDPDAVWRQAEQDLSANRIDQAERSVDALARLRPPTARDWMLRAQVATARGRIDAAIAALGKIGDRDPLASQAQTLAGQLELRRNRVRAAEKHFVAATALDASLVKPRRELVFIYGMQLRRKELGAQFRALSELTPLTYDNVFHWCLTRSVVWEPREIVNTMKAYLKADPDDRWSRLALVESLRQLGRLDEASRALAYLPESDAEARAARVRLALARGDDRAAEALLAAGPRDHAELARLRGRLALARHDAATALRQFEIAHRADADDGETCRGLAAALTMTGDDARARPLKDEARDHDRFNALMQRASIPENKNDRALLLQLGAACEAIHRLHEARAWYNLAIGLDPFDNEAQQARFRVDAALAQTRPAAAPVR